MFFRFTVVICTFQWDQDDSQQIVRGDGNLYLLKKIDVLAA